MVKHASQTTSAASPPGGSSPLGGLSGVAATAVAMLQTRLALLGNEVQMQKLLITQQLGLGLALVFCLGLGVLLATALAVQVWWEHRTAVLGTCTALFIALAGYFYIALRRTFDAKEVLFSASIAELQEDLRQLKAAAQRTD